MLDLRQFATWCHQHGIRLSEARRADIECFARELEAKGRGRSTVSRRLITIVGLYKYAVEEELLAQSPAAHVWRLRLDYESHAVALDRNEVGALLLAAGLGSAAEHPSSPSSPSTASGSPKHPAPTSRTRPPSAATAPWPSPARAARKPSSRWPRTPRGRSTSPSANAATGTSSSLPPETASTGTEPGEPSAAPPNAPTSTKKIGRTPCSTRSLSAALDAGVPLRDVQEAASHADARLRLMAGLHHAYLDDRFASSDIQTRQTSAQSRRYASFVISLARSLVTFRSRNWSYLVRVSRRRAQTAWACC
jgi:integrase/recombinase XerD